LGLFLNFYSGFGVHHSKQQQEQQQQQQQLQKQFKTVVLLVIEVDLVKGKTFFECNLKYAKKIKKKKQLR